MSEPAAPPPSVLQAGGALGLDKLYVERPADRELHRALSAGEFCYVLAPRQSGKSSLRVRTAARLRAAGVLCATLDLTQIGVKVTLDEWYFGLIDMISERLSLPDPGEFWEQRRQVSPVQRMLRYLRDVVLAQVAQPVVLFIDEIDTVLALDLPRDDFFAAIRSLYNQRAEDPKCHRLTFCLLGVAAPADLMRDPSRTPFNIGQDIRLDCRGLDKMDNDFVIGLIGKELFPLSAMVQAMRKTRQTSEFLENLGPFFIGRVLWQSVAL